MVYKELAPVVDQLELTNIRGYSPALAEALPRFMQAYDALQDQAQAGLDSEVPADFSFASAIDQDVFHTRYVLYDSIRSFGGEVAIVGAALAPEQALPDDVLAVYEKQVVTAGIFQRLVGRGYNASDIDPAVILLEDAIGSGSESSSGFVPPAYLADRGSKFSWFQDDELVPLAESGLIEATFMLAVLRGLRNKAVFGRDSSADVSSAFNGELVVTKARNDSMAAYQKLYEAGHWPLELADVQGIMKIVLQEYIAKYPNSWPGRF